MFEDISGKSHIHLGLTAIALKTMRVLIAYDLRPVSAPRLISQKIGKNFLILRTVNREVARLRRYQGGKIRGSAEGLVALPRIPERG